MFSSMRTLTTLIIMMLALSGCGDLLGKKVIKKPLDSSQFQINCDLDLDKFSEILNTNIGSQIRCLGENLRFFTTIVKSGKPGYLSRVQLELYLSTRRPDVKPEFIRAVKAVFDLGHLITGDDPDYISRDTIDKVIDFALVFNQEAALHYGRIFQNTGPVSYMLHRNHRDRVSNANLAIIQSLRNVFNYNRGNVVHKLNIIELLESFSSDGTSDTIQKVKNLLFLKKVIIGGEEEVVTHLELERLIMNFDHMVLIALDLIRYKYIDLNQESLLQMLKTDINDFYNIVTYGPLNNRDNETLFTIEKAILAVKQFFSEDSSFDIDKFKKLIVEAKKIAMKGDGVNVKGSELKTLFNHAKSLLQTGTVFHRIYLNFKTQMEDPRPVEQTIDFSEYRNNYPQHQEELDQFERIAKRYRFMKGIEKSSYYVDGSRRNPEAMVEIALYEYLLRLLFIEYGVPTPMDKGPSIGGYSIDQKKFQALVKNFKTELEELKLITPRRWLSTADSISLLGTLFQYQSDNNGLMDVNEGTEFAVSLFSSLNISEDVHNYLMNHCPADAFDRIDSDCFRQKFWKGLCTTHKKSPTESYSYRDYYPLMFNYLGTPVNCDDMTEDQPGTIPKDFLDTAILASRSCNYFDQTTTRNEPIPFSKGDMMTIMLALMHTETTMLRWDINKNHVMDPSEVDTAYSIYRGALAGFLSKQNPIIQKLHKQIYLYLIKYEQVPDAKNFKSIWKFVKFLVSFKWKATATRKTMVSILNVLGTENAKSQTGPAFECHWLRDPNNIPPEPETTEEKNLVADASMTSTTNRIMKLDLSLRDKLREELDKFVDDMIEYQFTNINQVRQTNLKKLFKDIAKDATQMREINTAIPEGLQIEKIGFAVSAILSEEKAAVAQETGE